jgi:hypothetical protein
MPRPSRTGKQDAERRRIDPELLADHRLAGRAPRRVGEVFADGAVHEEREHAQPARLVGFRKRDECDVRLEDRREVAHELGEHRLALRARDCERGAGERRLGARALDLRGDAHGEDLERRFRKADLRERLAVHRHDESQRVARRVGERVRGIAVHPLGAKDRPGRKRRRCAAVDVMELPAHDLRARRAGKRVLEAAQHLAVEPGGQRAHVRARLIAEHGGEGGVHAQDFGELAHELLDDVRAAHAGDCEGGAMHDLGGAARGRAAVFGRGGRRSGRGHRTDLRQGNDGAESSARPAPWAQGLPTGYD